MTAPESAVTDVNNDVMTENAASQVPRRWRILKSVFPATIAGLAALVIAFLVGENHAMRTSMHAMAGQTKVDTGTIGPNFALDSLPIADASAAVSSEKYSLATGTVSDDADGLFLLDHNSGLLQCQVIYPRSAQIMARFSVNVAEALGIGGKGGSYLLLTGRVNFPRASNNPAAQTVAYVMDTATGNYACFGVPFNTSLVNSNRPQNGVLVPIASGSANPLVDRDRLR